MRTAPAQSIDLFPSALLEEKVRTLSALSPAEPAIDPEKLLSQLSYSHFEQLVELTDPLKRRFYEIEALRGNWSVRELRRRIDSQYFERSRLSTNKNMAARQVQPPIGILLCTRKNHELVEYALAGVSNTPMNPLESLSRAEAKQNSDVAACELAEYLIADARRGMPRVLPTRPQAPP